MMTDVEAKGYIPPDMMMENVEGLMMRYDNIQ
jgi:hypothetical protein